MSGICGIIAADPTRRVAPEAAAAMLRASDVTRAGGGSGRSWGPASVAAAGAARAPAGIAEATVDGEHLLLTFQGALFDANPLGGSATADRAAASLLDAYVERGIGFVGRLAGDFAIAVWDGRRHRVFLAVDRFRVQPLSYLVTPRQLVFASRMQGLLAAPDLPALRVGPECVLDVVALSIIPTPRTIFREVRKLPPGSVLEWDGTSASVRAYWDLSFRTPCRDSFRELARETQRSFRASVEARLAADGAPEKIGAFLSGGVDSSTVAGELTRLTGRPTKTFSIGFAEQSFNEIEYARIVSRAFGTDHHEYFVTPKDTVAALDVLARNFDEPYANSSAVPVYYCAKLARDSGVDVLYAGDAGDELFAGNPWYASQRVFGYWHRIPAPLREGLVKPVIQAGESLRLPLFEKALKYVRRAEIPLPQRLTSYGFFSVIPAIELFEGDFLKAAGSDYDPNQACYGLYREAPADDELDKLLYVDLKLIISDNDVIKVVRMVDAAGVGVRFPFLDHRFAEFAASVPASRKMRGRRLRSFFKKAYSDLLPREVLRKKKHGFGLPIPVWLRTDPELHAIMRDLVLGSTTLSRGIYRKDALERIVERHRDDPTSFYGTALWHIMMVEMWMRRHSPGVRSWEAAG